MRHKCLHVPLSQATESFTTDEHPRGKATMESLAKLPSVFKKDGTVTAGNASGICDGAAANIVASESALKEHSLKPLARIVSYAYSACEPSIMGIGPCNPSRRPSNELEADTVCRTWTSLK